ncbi:MAG TPA: hypothetical protein VFA78_08605 [Chloroflexota bacterium]|nr:hypothetical protein [Chloroflexota bacterium]
MNRNVDTRRAPQPSGESSSGHPRRRASFSRVRPVTRGLTAVALAGAVLAAAVSPALARPHASTPAAAPVRTTSAHILVNSKGRTLYVFAADTKDTSSCYGQCAAFWPPVLVKSGVTPASKIAGIRGTFGVATRTDGTRQLTYDGAPLYTFSGDKKKGQMNGQGLVASGGYWWVVAAAGK